MTNPSYDSESDLTELSSSDEEDIPIASVAATATRSSARIPKKVPTVPKPRLSAPRMMTFSLDWVHSMPLSFFVPHIFVPTVLIEQVKQGLIDLDPEYQRGFSRAFFPSLPVLKPLLDVVWTEAKQSCLIDSIFQNFPIPPIIFGTPLSHLFSPSLYLITS